MKNLILLLPFILSVVTCIYSIHLLFKRGIIASVIAFLMLSFNLTIWGFWLLPDISKNLITTYASLFFTLLSIVFFVIARYVIKNSEKQNDNDIEKEFNRLAEKWKQDLELYSHANVVYSHPDHLKIIGMGKKVLPYILKDLKKAQNFWFYALIQITGERPVKEEDKGNHGKMTERWLEWARLKKIEF